MGKKLDALFGRTFKSHKFKSLLNLSLTRLSILKNQRQVRFSQATSDVSELLKLGQHETAFHRVNQVIKDQNMLDVFVFIHGYCNLLLDHVHLLEQHKECPEELLEAVSSLLFAASRIGEFPELQEIRTVLISRFGKDLAARSIELRSNCGVNIKMVQKLSTRPPPKEVRMKVLKEIAAENNVVLKLEEASSSNKGILEVSKAKVTSEDRADEIGEEYGVLDSVKRGKKYKDVADAAQAAFESAAHAAAAARAAVELSQSSPRGPDNRDYPGDIGWKKPPNDSENKKPKSDQEQGNEISEDEGSCQGDVREESKRSTSDSEEPIDEVSLMSFREDPVKLLEKDIALYDSEEETQYGVKTTTITVKDELDPMDGPNGVDVVHPDHMVRLAGNTITREAGMKGPVSVRTRRVRGY